jgi:hypothetical protein
MFRRTLMTVGILGAAVGIPYVASEWPRLKASVLGASSDSPSTKKPATNSPGQTNSQTPSIIYPAGDPRALGLNPPSEETPLVDMADAFRFNVTPPWVMSRWPRVTAGIPHENYHAMRVPLITGMRNDDVAGALTYYFMPTEKCAKITFTGATGDPTRFVALMTERFGFKGFTYGEPGVQRYEVRWNGKALSELLVRAAAIVRATNPLARYEVQLTLTDPSVR